MKKASFLIILLVNAYLLIFTGNCFSQWEQDVRLTNDPSGSYTRGSGSSWCLGTNGQIIHTIWHDHRDGNWEIYYKRSTDGGTTWETDTRITNDPGQSATASIAVSGSFVHLVWCDIRNGNYDIYYKRSSNNGTNWDIETRLTYDTSVSDYPCIAVSGQNIYVVWQDSRNNNQEIYFKSSTNAGLNWGSDIRCTNDTAISKLPSLSVSGSNINIIWEDTRDGNYEIYFMKSADGGNTWSSNQRLTYNTATSQFPSLTSSGLFLHTVWYDDRDGNWEIYYKRSTDGGISWNVDQRLTNNPGISSVPSVTSSGPIVHVAWVDDRDGGAFTSEIYYKRSFNNGLNWENDTRLTYDAAVSLNPSISVSGSLSNVVWSDARNGDFEIYYKRNPTGNQEMLQAPSNLIYNSTENRLTWALSPSTNVSKYLVYKKGNDNIWKSVADSGGMVNSNQNYYNIQISGYNYYKVAAISNTGDTAKCDSILVSRGFVLKKMYLGTIEPYKILKHSFNFINSESVLWPSSWWSQFLYTQDPPYPKKLFYHWLIGVPFLCKACSKDFPDWITFTEVFGKNSCYTKYISYSDSVFSPFAVNKWLDYNGKRNLFGCNNWGGSCIGFSIASVLSFNHNLIYYSQFPVISGIDNVYSLNINDPGYGNNLRKVINHLASIRFCKSTSDSLIPLPEDGTPNSLLNLLISRFSSIYYYPIKQFNEILILNYSHAVVPYAIERNSISGIYDICIYDNNFPGDLNRKISININLNTWSYSGYGNNNNKDLLLLGDISRFLGTQNIFYKKNINNFDKLTSDSLTFYSPPNKSIFIIKQNDTISGFNNITGNVYGDKNNVFFNYNSNNIKDPIGYFIPKQNTKIIMNNYDSSVYNYASLNIDSFLYIKFYRIDTTHNTQTDILKISNNNLTIYNPDNQIKKINLISNISDGHLNKMNKYIEVRNYKMNFYDSSSIGAVNNNSFILKNYGQQKTYSIFIVYSDTLYQKYFNHFQVPLIENSSHLISPVWDSLNTRPVKIYVDVGNNGTIDDTLLISDTLLTKIHKLSEGIPEKFALYQNYPNPFNPFTKIRYSIPQNTFVKLEIFDILGRKIEALVNENQSVGTYEATFDASQYPSGIYFYKITTIGFSETKKMVFIK